MKILLFSFCLSIITFSSCKKDSQFDAAKQAAADDAAIQTYLAANTSITATKDPSGLYYQVITAGSGVNPTINSTLTVNYAGKLLNGTTFDSGSGITFPLTNVIKGWQIGLPKIAAGGRVLLIIPSALAYGNSSPSAGIPNNSVLVFTIDLLSFK